MTAMIELAHFAILFVFWLIALLWIVSHFNGIIKDSVVIGYAVLIGTVAVSGYAAYTMTYHLPHSDVQIACHDRQGSYDCD